MRLRSLGHVVQFVHPRYDSSSERLERNEKVVSSPVWSLILLGKELRPSRVRRFETFFQGKRE